eukprot:CFRG7219T1
MVGISIQEQFIEKAQLLRKKSTFTRLDVGPFLALYIAVVFAVVQDFETNVNNVDNWHVLVAVAIGCGAVHILVHLFTHWSSAFCAQCQYKYVDYLPEATHVLVTSRGIRNQIVRIATTIKEQTHTKSIFYEHMKYVFMEDTRDCSVCLAPLSYPDTKEVDVYRMSTGFATEESIGLAEEKFGINKFDIPIPSFLELLKEQALAPFFVFQVFCVGLWSMDEYIYYSVFTLLMLVVFECTVVAQRRKNLTNLLSLCATSTPMRVYRTGKWVLIGSHRFLPGDIVAIEPGLQIARGEMSIPCDMLLLSGSCVTNESMLTGESKPRQKESPTWTNKVINTSDDGATKHINKHFRGIHHENITNTHRECVLFGGTVMVHSTATLNYAADQLSIPPPPLLLNDRNHLRGDDIGTGVCLAYVLRTGFSTTQGQLVRKILFSSQRVTANNRDSFYFILFLLVFAVAAAIYVWVERVNQQDSLAMQREQELAMNTTIGISGTTDSDFTTAAEGRWRIVLECLLIITSVVPPELPMELSLAVNSSMGYLSRLAIFCTEPFRIPLAGKVDVCCFDKTGTLTSDQVDIEGVVVDLSHEVVDENSSIEDAPGLLTTCSLLPSNVELAMATCHSASIANTLKTQIIADPLEKAMLRFVDWLPTKDGVTIIKRPAKRMQAAKVRIVRKFPFNSHLKRMTTIVEQDNKKLFVASKGAPEIMATLLTKTPTNYHKVFEQYAAQGYRVLTLATKTLLTSTLKDVNSMDRLDVERELKFAGFLIVSCKLKPETRPTIRALRQSGHKVLMITGDSLLTACHVAQGASFVRRTKPMYMLLDGDLRSDEQPLICKLQSFGSNKIISTADLYETLKGEKASICISGKGLDYLVQTKQIDRLLRYVVVYARTTPVQKENILKLLNDRGHFTLMCGDGTNDVGALKTAHVGVALVDGGRGRDFGKAFGSSAQAVAFRKANNRQDSRAYKADQIDRPNGIAELGDASFASPFTSKIPSPLAVLHVLRLGRSTLATTLQMYKILAVNCLVNAYCLSFLYLDGVKFSDWQYTFEGIAVAMLFLFVALSEAAETLSPERPLPNVFSFYLISTVVTQFVVHVTTLVIVVGAAKTADTTSAINSPDDDFHPTMVNSVVFCFTLYTIAMNFLVNYEGQPFMIPLKNNKRLLFSICGILGLVLLLATDTLIDSIAFDVLPFPIELQQLVLCTLFFDGIACMGGNALLRTYLYKVHPKPL